MKISVIIPTYNSSATIEAALNSVLCQTLQPSEILVLDDGSNDSTLAVLKQYDGKIALFRQENSGVASARNWLCARASGDLIAFLDHDDVWHPNYLEIQQYSYKRCPNAVAFFTGHVDFAGNGNYSWGKAVSIYELKHDVIESNEFIGSYNKCPAPFGSMSFCCIPKSIMNQLGAEPFPVTVSGADDYYLFNVLPLLGQIVYTPIPLVAYRVSGNAQSADKLKSVGLAVRAFELIAESKRTPPGRVGARIFKLAFASQRRQYAKFLMGAGRVAEARQQLGCSVKSAGDFLSLAKSLGLSLTTYLPRRLQPKWPAGRRE
jgi:glycosyltransferase involved in cell wall biosynthesis